MYDFPQYQESYDFSQYGAGAGGDQVGCGCDSERVGARSSGGGGFDWGGVIVVAAAVGVLVVGYGVYKNVTTIGPAALRGANRAMEEG
jgi:hypothetical protein